LKEAAHVLNPYSIKLTPSVSESEYAGPRIVVSEYQHEDFEKRAQAWEEKAWEVAQQEIERAEASREREEVEKLRKLRKLNEQQKVKSFEVAQEARFQRALEADRQMKLREQMLEQSVRDEPIVRQAMTTFPRVPFSPPEDPFTRTQIAVALQRAAESAKESMNFFGPEVKTGFVP
jgi:PIN domain nuclease of toxin-antitoxin system